MGGLKRSMKYAKLPILMRFSVHALPPTLHINIMQCPLGVNHHLGLLLRPQLMANHCWYSLLMLLICMVRIFPCYSPDLIL